LRFRIRRRNSRIRNQLGSGAYRYRSADEANAAIFMDMVAEGPVNAITLVAEWHQVRNGKIVRAQSAFDGRPFAAMFTPPPHG
jgi:hypothetical protein